MREERDEERSLDGRDKRDKRDRQDVYDEYDVERRRAALARVYASLPPYDSPSFWRCVETTAPHHSLPLEVLVRCLRHAVALADETGRNRLVECIVGRVHGTNESWARHVLRTCAVPSAEHSALVADLHADLYEHLLRALLDPRRRFWEENFQHCLRFERQHVHHAFMVREGWWRNWHVRHGNRVPRALLDRLDRTIHVHGDEFTAAIEDEQAQQAFSEIERSELALLVSGLPEKLKAVVWLLFWENCSEKDAARLLHITDRTVRNRLRAALKLLQQQLEKEGAYSYG